MGPLEGIGHAAGGDGIRLHLENDEYQRRGERNDQPFRCPEITCDTGFFALRLLRFLRRQFPTFRKVDFLKLSIIILCRRQVKMIAEFFPSPRLASL
jgi:hypothetical protein